MQGEGIAGKPLNAALSRYARMNLIQCIGEVHDNMELIEEKQSLGRDGHPDLP